jgi:hypothetical protein
LETALSFILPLWLAPVIPFDVEDLALDTFLLKKFYDILLVNGENVIELDFGTDLEA